MKIKDILQERLPVKFVNAGLLYHRPKSLTRNVQAQGPHVTTVSWTSPPCSPNADVTFQNTQVFIRDCTGPQWKSLWIHFSPFSTHRRARDWKQAELHLQLMWKMFICEIHCASFQTTKEKNHLHKGMCSFQFCMRPKLHVTSCLLAGPAPTIALLTLKHRSHCSKQRTTHPS